MVARGRELESLVLEGLPLSDLDFRWRVVVGGGLVAVFSCIPVVLLWGV